MVMNCISKHLIGSLRYHWRQNLILLLLIGALRQRGERKRDDPLQLHRTLSSVTSEGGGDEGWNSELDPRSEVVKLNNHDLFSF